MATSRWFQCKTCNKRYPAPRLFDALEMLTRDQGPVCADCPGPVQLHLGFQFGLGAAGKEQIVERCFLPRALERWNDATVGEVKFYPFLVVVERVGSGRAVWWPYWHVVHNAQATKVKYGQWAPFMNQSLFADLMQQARAAGVLD